VEARETTVQAVVFQVDERSYALPLEQVVEVIRMVAVTPVPDAPAWVKGVINLRGSLIPMIDLRPRFGAPAADVDPSQVFLVARAGGRTAAVSADCVEDVVDVSCATGGLGRSKAGAVVVLDLEHLLAGAAVGGWAGREGSDEVGAHSATA
jgi:purine-binding chemotaxis protein CheW